MDYYKRLENEVDKDVERNAPDYFSSWNKKAWDFIKLFRLLVSDTLFVVLNA